MNKISSLCSLKYGKASIERIDLFMKKKLLALSVMALVFTGCGAADVTVTSEGVASDALGIEAGLETSATDTSDAVQTDVTADTAGVTETADATDIAAEGMTVIDGVATEITAEMMHEKPVQAPPTDPNIYKTNGYVLVNSEGQPTYPNPEEGSPEVLPETGGIDEGSEEAPQISDDELKELLNSLED